VSYGPAAIISNCLWDCTRSFRLPPAARSDFLDYISRNEDPIMSEGQGAGGGIVGTLGFVGIIVLLNVLSYVFNWGWYFY
jgi:hypothetical protein